MKKISTAHFLLLFIVLSQFMLSFVLQAAGVRLSVPVALLLSQGSIILPVAVYCIWKQVDILELIRFRKIKVSTALMTVLIGLASYPVVVCLNLISMLFVENALTAIMPDILSMGLGAGLVLMAFLPAVVEETVFRGVIYNTYSKRNPLFGVFLSALLFGLMHMNFNQMPYAFYLGIVMALLMEACDSILAPMILHLTMNGTSTLLSFVSTGATEVTESVTEATDLKGMLLDSYRQSMESMGMEMTEAQFAEMIPGILAMMIGVFVVFALIGAAVVFMLVYGVFRSNNRKLKEVFKEDYSATAYIMQPNGTMKKNRMIDIWLILFIIYTLWNCVMSIG